MKKSVVKLLQSFLLLGASILSGFAFYSCGEDAGLGGAIDTKAPTLSIDYPKESGSAIRDQFILAGTVTDDKSIARVTVNVKSLDDGGKISDTYSASFDPVKNRWWVDINRYDASAAGYYNGWQYPDGNYEFSVTAFDNAGNNSGTYSKTFEIDNTPPVFIISNPGVIKKTNLSASAYGSLFTIDGTISDNHTISFMDVKIYDANGKCVSSESYEGENLPYYREEDVATAGGTSVQIAQYANAAVENRSALNTRYSQLHESDSGTEYYYAEIKLTDSTKVYRNPWGEDARSADEISADQLGNSTSKLYLYDDVFSSLMSAKKGLGLSAANLKDIISGVYSGSASKESVLQTLNEKVYDTSLVEDDPMANKLSFSLNPEANPTYNVNGFEFGFGDEAVLSASSGNTVSVTISAGLDKTNIAPEVVRVWMKTYAQKPTDQAAVKSDLITLGKEVVKFEKYNDDFAGFMDKLHESPENPATTITTGGANWVLIYDYSLNNSRSSSVSTKTFSVTLPDGIELSKYYILGVTGCDIEDLEFAQNTVYGFEGNTAGVPPTIDIETPDNLSVWANFAAPSFTGTASLSTKSLYVSELTASLSIIEDGSTKKNIGEFTDTITCKIENDEKVWSTSAAQALTYDKTEDKWHLDASKLPGLLKVYETEAPKGVLWLATLKVSGKSSSGHTGEKTLSVKIDTVAPVVSISSVTPTVLGSEYFGDSDTNTYLNGKISIKGNISDTNLLETEEAVTYDVLASIGDEEPVSILADLIANKEDVGADFDGKLGSVYSINESFDTRAISKFFHDFKEKGEDEKIKIEVVVTATDKAGNKGSYSSSLLNGGKNFVIYQETDRPKIELGNADLSITEAKNVKVNHNLFGTTSNNKLTINFSDDDSIAEYEVYVYDEKGEPVKETEVSAQTDNVKANPYKYYPGKTTAALSYVLPSKEAKYQVEIKARDYLTTGLNTNPYGEKSVGKFFVAVDSGAPMLTIANPNNGAWVSRNDAISVSGTVSKRLDTKVTGFVYKEGDNKKTPIAALTSSDTDATKEAKISDKPTNGVYNWTGSVKLPSDANGNYKFDVKVTDGYDQTSSLTYTFGVDISAPTLVISNVTADKENLITKKLITDENSHYDSEKGYLISGTWEDTQTGTNKLYYSTDLSAELTDSSKRTEVSAPQTTGKTSFSFYIPLSESDDFGFKIWAVDGAGNSTIPTEGSTKFSKLRVDLKKPAVNLDYNGSSGSITISDSDKIKTQTLPFSFNAVFDDTNVPDSADAAFTTKTVSSGSVTVTSFASKKAVFSVDGLADETSATITLQGTDTRSRKSNERNFILSYDKTAPRITLNEHDLFQSSDSLELSGNITEPNFDKDSSPLKVYLVPVEVTNREQRTKAVNVTNFEKNATGYKYIANFSGLEDISYNIAIVAKDTFGNVSYYSTKSDETTGTIEKKLTGSGISITGLMANVLSGTISIDSKAPDSTVTLTVGTGKKIIHKQNGSMIDLDDAPKFGKTYYTNGLFTLGGIITETNLVLTDADVVDGTAVPTLTVSKEGAQYSSVPFTLGSNDGSGNYVWSYTPNYATNGNDDGSYDYVLTLWDKSKQQFSKTVTVVLDTAAPELSITSPSDGESFESKPIAKIAYSDDGVGIDTTTSSEAFTYIVKNITDSANVSDVPSSNYEISNGSATGTLTFKEDFNTEGTFSFSAKVKDYLGYEKVSEVRTFYFDKSKPTVTEGSVGNSGLSTNGLAADGSIPNSLTVKNFKLSGTVSDTNALYNNGIPDTNGKTAITISATVNGTEKTWKIPLTLTNGKKAASWEKVFVVGSNNSSAENYLPDGTYNFTIVATDVAGKTNQISRTVKVDTVAPQISSKDVKTSKVTWAKGSVSEDWYKTDALNFAGKATDNDGTGISEIYYQTTESEESTIPENSWTAKQSFAGTSDWKGTIESLKSGKTKIRIIAVDNAGNKSEPVILGPYNIDTTYPNSDINLSSDGKLLDSKKEEVSKTDGKFALDFEKTYYTDSTFTLGGTITEENIDENNLPKLTVSKDGGTPAHKNFTTGGTAAGDWSYEPNYATNGTADGEYKYTLTVKDKVGNEFSKSVTVVVDTKKPVISITSPSDGESFEASPSAKFAYSDDGVGIKTTDSTVFTYEIKNITESDTGIDVDSSKYGITNGTATSLISFNNQFTDEGTFKITAKVRDYLGHESDITADNTRTFYFDKSKPTITESKDENGGVGENGLTTNAETITLKGVVYDTNALAASGVVKISGTWNGGDKNVDAILTPASKNVTVNGTTYSLGEKQYATWTYTFNTAKKIGLTESEKNAENYLPDGTYTFTIVATDVAGKTNQISRTVTVDTQAPEFGTGEYSSTNTTNVAPYISTTPAVKILSGTSTTEKWYKTNSLRVEGTASDNLSGIKEVYYQIGTPNESSSITWGDKKSFAGTNSWAGTIESLQSKKQIRVIAVDNAGNESAPVTFADINIDINEPQLVPNSVMAGKTADTAAAVSSLYVNGKSELVVKFKVSDGSVDSSSGIDTSNVYISPYTNKIENTTGLSKATALTTTDGKTEFTVTIDKGVLATGTIYARIYDYAGNYSDVNLLLTTLDNEEPKIQSSNITDKTEHFTAYENGKDDSNNRIFYLNNDSSHKFTIGGVATDNLGLAKVQLDLTGAKLGDKSNSFEITDADKLASWSFDDLDLSGLESGALATITLSDKAGNTDSISLNIQLDNVGPEGIHDTATDKDGQDLYFRMGENNNDLSQLNEWKSAISTLDSALDMDVGGKYSSTTYGNSQTIRFRGKFDDDTGGSGVDLIYYKLTTDTPDDNTIENFRKNYSSQSTGYFSLSSSPESKRVSYKDASGNRKFAENIQSNFKTLISGFTSAKQYLILVAVDKVGNAKVDGTYYTINVDSDLPEIDTVVTDNIITNGKVNEGSVDETAVVIGYSGNNADTYANYTIRGTVDDASAGIRSISIDANGNTIDKEHTDYGTIKIWDAHETDKPNKKNWAITLKKKLFVEANTANKKSISISLNAIDDAGSGNSQKAPVATIVLDTTPPEVTLTAPSDAYTATTDIIEINGIISLSGTAKDGNTLPENGDGDVSNTIKKIQYSTDKTSWQDLAVSSIKGNYTFTAEGFDTTQLTDEQTYYLRAVAQDVAGNTGYSTNEVKIKVSQNTDRPVIKITSLANSSSWLTSKALKGSISDDDGLTGLTLAVSEDGTSYSNVTVNNGNWTYTFSGAAGENDGQKSLYFKVVDAKTTEFVSASTVKFTGTEKYKRPYYLYDTTASSEYDSTTSTECGLPADDAIVINLDTAAPRVFTLGMDISTTATSLKEASVVKEATGSYTINEATKAGGNSKYIKFYVPVFDANLKDVKISIADALSGTVETKYSTATETNQFTNGVLELTKATADSVPVTIEDNGVTYTYYESSPITIASDAATNLKTFKVIAYDNAGNETPASANFYIDNTGPETIVITSPSVTDEVTGTINIVGTASDVGSAGISSIEWLVPPNTYTAETTDAALAALEGWTSDNNTKGSASVWNFKFLAGSATDLTVYDDTTKYKVEHNTTTNIYKIPLFFKTTDALGNVYIKRDFYVTHNPDADRPVTEFNYPTTSDYDSGENYVTLAGTIRVSGTVEIPSGTTDVGQVYIQIGTVAADGTKTWSKDNAALADEFATLAAIVENGGVKTKTDLDAIYYTEDASGNKTSKVLYVQDDWWGIPVNTKTATWNISLNSDGKLDPAANSTTNIALRACAINADGKMGLWTDAKTTDPIYIHVDANAPGQTAVMRQYPSFSSTDMESNVSLQKDYSPEMYLKGKWYAVVTLKDNDSLDDNTLKVKRGSVNLKKDAAANGFYLSAKTWEYTEGAATIGETAASGRTVKSVSQKVYIPIDTEALGSTSVNYSVYIEDTSHFASTMTYNFFIDNKAPEFSTLTGNSDNLLAASSAGIENSNYVYNLGGKLKEEGSGFSRIFFYFLRNNVSDSSAARLLDSQLDYSATGNDGRKQTDRQTNVSDYFESFTAALDTYTVTQGTSTFTMYGKTYAGSLGEDGKSFESTAGRLEGNKHIRKGGLIFIGGDYHKITEVSGTTVEFEDEVSTTVTEAGFPYGQVVDHTEKSDMNDETHVYNITGDDGDEMPESAITVSSTTTWEGTIYSDRMTDGPVTLVCIAFDQAGNVAEKRIVTKIKNNAPRLAKLYLGTDLSGDGKYSDNEFNTYQFVKAEADGSYKDAHGNFKESVELETAGTGSEGYSSYGKPFEIRSGLAVVPEITGGNGAIKLAYLKSAGEKTAVTGSAASVFRGTDTSAKITATFSPITNATSGKADTVHKFILEGTDFSGLTDGTGKKMSFTFWDSTDGTVCGTDSNNCYVYVSDFTLALNDSVAPKSVINPFYWNGLKDNSVYGSSTVTYASQLKGHIELESDWTAKDGATKLASGYDDSATSGEFDGDPKVSGKITMTGYAYDNQRLSSLWIAFDKFTPAAYLSTGGDAAATANTVAATGGTYVNSGTNGDNETYYQVAYFTPSTGNWKKTTASMAANGWEFVLTDEKADSEDTYLSQSGHKVKWTLSIDTEKCSPIAATDIKARVIAFDHKHNVVKVAGDGVITTTLTNKDGSDNVPLYQMDVVPYIVSVGTSLDELYSGTASVYSRTARGHYSVYDKEKIKISGFNFGGTSTTVTVNGTAQTVSSGSASNLELTLADATRSGNVELSVETVAALNNKNNNAANGGLEDAPVTEKYNMQANSINNNVLTDNVVLDIWEYKTAATPRDGEIQYPEMQIGPNGEVGFAFVNGNFYFNMAGPSTLGHNSQTENGNWASQRAYESDYAPYFESALAFDSNGRTFGISTNQDSNTNYSAYTTFYFGKRADNTLYGNNGNPGWNGKASGNYNGGAYRRRLQTTTSTVNNGIQDTSVFRAMSPSLATVTNSDASTTAYIAFYDAVRKEIRYRWGTVGSDATEYKINSVTNSNLPDGVYAVGYYDGDNNRYGHLHDDRINNNIPHDQFWHNNRNYYGNRNNPTVLYAYDIDGNYLRSYYMGYNINNPSNNDYWLCLHETNEHLYEENYAINPFPTDIAFLSLQNNKSNDIKNITSTITYTGTSVKKGDKLSLTWSSYKFGVGAYNKTYSVTSASTDSFVIDGYVKTRSSDGNNDETPIYFAKVTGQLMDATGGYYKNYQDKQQAQSGTTDQSVASNMYTVVARTSATKTTASVAIGAVPASIVGGSKDVVCVAWYDSSSRSLKFAYEEDPQRDDDNGAMFTNVSTIESAAGYYVHMKVDTAGGIHMAYFTTTGAKLKYAYAPSYSEDFTIVEVDTYSLTANDIGLDVAKDSAGNLVPYISYLSGNQVSKVAFPVKWSGKAATLAGIENNAYTGNWEIAVVPSSGYTTDTTGTAKTTVADLTPKYDTVCVGVHKNWSTGVLAAIPSKVYAYNISKDDTDSNRSTRLGGNATTNPALAYTVIGDDSLQLAQMK